MWNIILAGILGLPLLLLAVVTAPLIAVLAIPPLLLLVFRKEGGSDLPPDQVVIAGGSSGIGLSIAQECVRLGISKVTILARNPKRLEDAEVMLQALKKRSEQCIQTVSVSVSDHQALQKVAKDLKIMKEERVVLFNCAGIPYTTEFDKIPVEQYEKLVKTNQLGAMYLVKAFLPYLHKGCIVLT